MSAEAVLGRLRVSVENGLDPSEVRRRQRVFGLNSLREPRPKGLFSILLDQLKSLIVVLLTVAAGLSFLYGHFAEAAAIVAVIVINTAIGFFTELRALRSMEALRRLSVITAKVRRDGQVAEIPAKRLVPGDIVLVEGGDIVGADLRLIEASKLQCDQSILTGESLPIMKHIDPLAQDLALPDQTNMLFQGTAVTRGSGEGVVVATGIATELGQIASLVGEGEEGETPLERRIDHLSRQLVWATLGLAAVIGTVGILTGKPPILMVETAIALAVAAVPEGLPMVSTLALARGMWRMVRRNALIERLAAVETLGTTTVILTDKTGTLTVNRMTAVHIAVPTGDVLVGPSDAGRDAGFTSNGVPLEVDQDTMVRAVIEVGVLCNNAVLSPSSEVNPKAKSVGDPTEVALLNLGARTSIFREDLLKTRPELLEEAFDPELKMMATVHQSDGRCFVAVKGAPEALLNCVSHVADPAGSKVLSNAERAQWHEKGEHLAARGLRVLAIAFKVTDRADDPVYSDLTLLGLVGLHDPPREDVAPAIAACKRAGIRVVMVTGDHAVTAQKIAAAVGIQDRTDLPAIEGRELAIPSELSEADRQRLLDTMVFARVSPKQKLDLISLYQSAGAVVAMTGDGVNDAPALQKADIGVAMGQRGSQVAREASDMVLQDDAFGTIVLAIAQGRVIFANIRKFIIYLLSCNLSEIMVVGLAFLSGLPVPILPLQILYLNLVTDVFPAFALGAGEGEADIMDRRPRDPKEQIVSRRHWSAIVVYSTIITAATLAAFGLAMYLLGEDEERAVTISFLTLALSQVWHVFNMRDAGTPFLRNEVTRNPYVWGAVVICVGLLLSAIYLPVLATILGLSPPSAEGWGLAVGFSLVPWLFGQLALTIRSHESAVS
jgi:Ca2+-transporting ATPase